MSQDQVKTETHEVLGMRLPVIDGLPDGYRLVAHPNGPAVASNYALYALELMSSDKPLPLNIRRMAIERYLRWSWPQVRDQFDFREQEGKRP